MAGLYFKIGGSGEMKTNEEILKEIKMKALEKGGCDSHFETQDIKKAIALTRENCEKDFEQNMDLMNKSSYKFGFLEGQKAERERILRITKPLIILLDRLDRNAVYDIDDKELKWRKALEELKKEMLKYNNI